MIMDSSCFPALLKTFLKKYSNVDAPEGVECFTMELDERLCIQFLCITPEVLFVQCNFGDEFHEALQSLHFSSHLLLDNNRSDRKIAPLYWATHGAQLTCSGFLYYDAENSEQELLGLLSVLSEKELEESLLQVARESRVLAEKAVTPLVNAC